MAFVDVAVPPSVLSLVLGPVLLLIVLQLVRSLQPRPLPAIPVAYPNGVAHTPWFIGQAGAFVQYEHARTRLLADLCAKHGPVCQLLVGPANTWFARVFGFGQVIVICSDVTEQEDAYGRRAAVFGKEDANIAPFKSALPYGMVSMRSGPGHRNHRKVFGPSMTGTYLARMVPRIEDCVKDVLELWALRAAIAKQGSLVNIKEDIMLASMDIMASITFGKPSGGVADAHGYLRELQARDPSFADPNARPEIPRVMEAALILLRRTTRLTTMGPLMKLGRLYTDYLDRRHRAARRDLLELINNRLEAEEMRMASLSRTDEPEDGENTSSHALSQADCVVAMVSEFQSLAGSGASLSKDEIRDELLSYIIGGAETTATALMWALKFIGRYPSTQERCRAELLEQGGGSALDFSFIQDESRLPYFHAVVYECLRFGVAVGATSRTPNRDTTVLGYPVPKGTLTVFVGGWSSRRQNESDRPLAEEFTKLGKRGGDGSRKYGWWDAETCNTFRPERWLKTVDGKEVFDRNAGPMLLFGAGARGCFGKPLAILEVKIFIARLLTTFRLEPIAAEADSDESKENLTNQPLEVYVDLEKLV